MDILANVEITYDHEYKAKLNEKIANKYGSKVHRDATHVSDLLMCLRKAWGKQHIPESEWMKTEIGADDDPLITWMGGLLFEEFVSEGEKQKVSAYCFNCRMVSSVPNPFELNGELHEVARCTSCGARWLIGTPDWIEGGIIHESKQTRKSRRGLPQTAPWYLEQVVSYMLFAQRRGGEPAANWSRLVAECLMADYSRAKKGERPKRPLASIDAFRVAYVGSWQDWEDELSLRKSIVEGETMPTLTGMPTGYRVPAYFWECSSCEVGRALHCENYKWDENDMEIGYEEKPKKVGKKEANDVAVQEGDS